MSCNCGERAIKLADRLQGRRTNDVRLQAPEGEWLRLFKTGSGPFVVFAESDIRRYHFRATLFALIHHLLFAWGE